MQKKLTITIDEEVYEGLHKRIGPRKISKFVEDLVRPHVVHPNFESAYRDMAEDILVARSRKSCLLSS